MIDLSQMYLTSAGLPEKLSESPGHRTMTKSFLAVSPKWPLKQIASTVFIPNLRTISTGYTRIFWPMRTGIEKITDTSGYLPIPTISDHRPANVTEVKTAEFQFLRISSNLMWGASIS